METEIKGGNSQVGTANTQFIESTVIPNGQVSFNINLYFTESHQYDHREEIAGSQDILQQIQTITASVVQLSKQKPNGIQSEKSITYKRKPSTQAQHNVVKKTRVKEPEPEQHTQTSSTKTIAAVTDSDRILDSKGYMLEPGDAVWNDGVTSLYVGEGYTVWYQQHSKTMVKEKLDMTRPINKWTTINRGNLNVYSPEQRVQRVLQQVGRECPVPGGGGLDFLYWTFTGLTWDQCYPRRFRLLSF